MKTIAFACACLGLAGWGAPAMAKIEKAPWGESPDHQKVDIYTLTNQHGMSARITNYGAFLVSLNVPDKNGKLADVVLGYDKLEDYTHGTTYGAVIGRFANRIGGAQFTLEGKTFHLKANSGPNNIHGGPVGLSYHVYSATPLDGPSPALILHMVSPDGDQGFPGKLDFTVTYTLTASNALKIEYRATTDKPTVLNPTNHSYFNLKGAGNGDVLNHRLQVYSDAVTPTDANHMATGEVMKVSGTGFDFTRPKPIGKDISGPDPAIVATPGYDINFIVRGPMGKLRPAAHVVEPESGRVMDVWTTQPGVQLYLPNNEKPMIGKGGAQYIKRGAFCLETQHFANAPNIPAFPTTELKPGKIFYQVTEFRFSTAH
ncbi:MAG TPA: aldose epimerase family protein [Rhizomicrobium sp.]|nr:aldose epimerase family protein [Rhizomicrobium sp.]